jgi:hypothetical protein
MVMTILGVSVTLVAVAGFAIHKLKLFKPFR